MISPPLTRNCSNQGERFLSAPLVDDESDHQAADRAQNYYGNVCLSDDRIGQTQQDAEEEATSPTRYGNAGRPNYEANAEAIEERSEQRRPLIRKRERNH